MRKLIVLLATAGLLLGLTGSAQAGEFDPPNSTLTLLLGGLPGITISALTGTQSVITLGVGSSLGISTGHNIAIAGTAWSTVNFGPGTSLFTGVPLISNLKVTVNNGSPHLLQDGFQVASNQLGGGGVVGPGFGGLWRMNGQTVIHALNGAILLPVPLNKLGGNMGETTMVTLIGQNITVENGPFITNAWVITAITGNIITIPARGNIQGVAFTLQPTSNETAMTPSTNGGYASISGGLAYENHTVTISGTNNLASAASSVAGRVTVVAPLRINTSAIAGVIPGAGIAHFEFVPEPGTVLLLVSGAVGLAVIGRRRMRK